MHRLDRAFEPVFGDSGAYARLCGDAGLLLVSRASDEVVALAAWSVVLDEASLLNLVVHPEHRRAGIARYLLEVSLDRLAAMHVRELHLEVRESNEAAGALYTALGFTAVGRRAGYYAATPGRPREDAILMHRRLEERGQAL